jgi:hypothetical protein
VRRDRLILRLLARCRGRILRARGGPADRGGQRAVVDEAGHALVRERRAELVGVDRQVRHRVAADSVQDAAGVFRDHFDMAVEQHPVSRLGRIAVAERMPAVVRLGVLQDRDHAQ